MEIKETRFEKKANGRTYYVNDIVTPKYRATVVDPAGNILLQEVYGGFDKSVDFGRDLSMPESYLANKWITEKQQYLRRLEFQNLEFATFQADLIEVLKNKPIEEIEEEEEEKE